MDYIRHVNPRKAQTQTPQTQRIPGREDQVENSAGGFVFATSDWDRLDRFLVLGTEGGTYYVSERSITKENAKTIEKLIDEDGIRVVDRVVEISLAGRAPKNDPALFVLAMASAAADEKTRQAALAALPKVARIGTHLFHFAQYVEAFRGWGRALRRAVADWYNEKTLDKLALQLVKYKQRDGWSHRDLMRLAHPKADSEERNALYKWVTDPTNASGMEYIVASEQLSVETDVATAVKLIIDYNLPREACNTELLNSIRVWEALLEKMPLGAMIRNLGKMTSIGLLKPLSDGSKGVTEKLANVDALRRARVHPLGVLLALATYKRGAGVRGKLTWTPDQRIVDALDEAFYLAFQCIEPTGKNFLLGIDVSGSMTWGNIAGMPGINPNVAAAAMAMVTARSEQNWTVMGFAHDFRNLGITPRQSLDEVIRRTRISSFGSTDCALPMLWAMDNRINNVDAFVIYTDNETWAGRRGHPCQALTQYRNKTGRNAKLIVVGMTSTGFTIADPNDAGMMDVVGFDTAAPAVMANFVRGE